MSMRCLILAVGCAAVSLAADATSGSSVTYNQDILPVLQRNCQGCHRPGQIAPMSFLSYKEVRPWAKAMKAAVVSRKMPPWFADARYGHFKNDRSLPQKDIELIAKWADTGAAEGDAKDAPATVQWPENGWEIQPDLIIEGPSYDVPAKGLVEWTWVAVPSGFTQDTWVTSVEIKTQAPQVAHHICLSFRPHVPNVQYGSPTTSRAVIERDAEGNETLESKRKFGFSSSSAARPDARPDQLASQIAAERNNGGGVEECYEPGRQAEDLRPLNAAKLIPAGTDIWVNLHYTPNGTPVTDHIQLGFTVAKEQPQRRFFLLSAGGNADPKVFAIPPNDPNWASPSSLTIFNQDVEIVGLQAHMHVRGKDMTFHFEYPNGEKETLLSVPNYNFNWQLWYETSVRIPKGTKMTVTAHYDNSVNNKYNPDPNRTVYWGDQSWEEMMAPSYAIVADPQANPRALVTRGNPSRGEGDSN
jgi:hypothetical protein